MTFFDEKGYKKNRQNGVIGFYTDMTLNLIT